jgi:glutamine amidotransferase
MSARSSKVVVVDYGIGNLHSVVKALRHEGGDVTISSDVATIAAADRLVLPGVGAFGDGMRELTERNLIEPLRAYVKTGRPFLGICLGMQLLLDESEEFGRREGLGIVPGKVVEIPRKTGENVAVKIPHIGWNEIAPPPGKSWEGSLLADVPVGTSMYFVHSFAAVPDEEFRLADAMYGGFRVSASIRRDNVTGCQFHPEKSGALGLRIVNRFLR